MEHESARGSGPGGTLRLQIPAGGRYGNYTRERIAGFAADYVVEDDDLREFLTAIGEAFANAVEHAKSARPIELMCWFDDDRMIARISDSGVGFDVAERARDAAKLPPVFAERGRGMAIMDRCTDMFTVQSEPGKGTTVILGRHLRQRRPGHTYAAES